jgi:hypothetical protein
MKGKLALLLLSIIAAASAAEFHIISFYSDDTCDVLVGGYASMLESGVSII